ncbi:MAG: creatininase family protein [Proteobacteria bacterium]|nr:creatininase family protein [Pseudomonadota bacterium]
MDIQDLTREDLTALINPQTIAVIPLGAAAKEHGAHLPLANDFNLAVALSKLLSDPDVLLLPPVNYFHYPAFSSYPGSVSLRVETSVDLITDITRCVSSWGIRYVYVLNTGLSTMRVLEAAQNALRRDQIHFAYTDITTVGLPVEADLQQQTAGSHADELETSMMLWLRPDTVRSERFVNDVTSAPFGLQTRPSGVYGQPGLASAEKGRAITRQWLVNIQLDLDRLRSG